MNNLDFSKCRLVPYDHQRRGVIALTSKPKYGLFWQMRLGKTKTVIDTASFLREAGLLDAVVIVCPAQVKDVWTHPELGEVKSHAFVPYRSLEYNARIEDYADILCQETKDLLFVTMSHELLRAEDAYGDFPRAHGMRRCMEGKKVWVVYDEGSAFGNWKSLQTKSALHLNKLVAPGRTTLLDGTPIGNHPVEQYSKFKVLDPAILGYKNFHHFRAVHQATKPNSFAKRGKEYVGFQNQERIDARVRPFCEYLEQRDALDMPEKVPGFITVALKAKAWLAYCNMRDDMVAQLDQGIITAAQASVKVLRLAQMCSGFVGGVEDEVTGMPQTVELSDETCSAVVEWVGRRLDEDSQFKTVLWCRFRPELERLALRLSAKFKNSKVGLQYGAKKTYDGELHPKSEYTGSYILVAQQQAIRYGVNLSRADNEMFVSQDYNLVTRAQAEDRIQPGEGVRSTSLVMEVLVTGPQGQRTVTFDIKKALAEKHNVASRTAGAWKRILEGE